MFCIHQNEQLFRQKIYQVIAGYHEDDAADYLTHDPIFTQILGTPALASQPSLSRFFKRFDTQALDQLQAANQELLDRDHKMRQSDTLLIDLDSSHADTYGKQEQASYNAHYGTVGFHPLVAFDGTLIAYVLLKFLYTRIHPKTDVESLSFAGFTRLFLWLALPVKWLTYTEEILSSARIVYQKSDT